jgi:hypothetical protein
MSWNAFVDAGREGNGEYGIGAFMTVPRIQ